MGEGGIRYYSFYCNITVFFDEVIDFGGVKVGIQDRDWYKDAHKKQRLKEQKAASRNRTIGYCAVLAVIIVVYLLSR